MRTQREDSDGANLCINSNRVISISVVEELDTLGCLIAFTSEELKF